jgi:hypothetical protein
MNSQWPAASRAPSTSRKLASVTSEGNGLADMEKPCDGVSAIFTTHRTG